MKTTAALLLLAAAVCQFALAQSTPSVAAPAKATPAAVDTLAPTTTKATDLHDVDADAATVAEAHKRKAAKAARRPVVKAKLD
jgi:hypothetical protein